MPGKCRERYATDWAPTEGRVLWRKTDSLEKLGKREPWRRRRSPSGGGGKFCVYRECACAAVQSLREARAGDEKSGIRDGREHEGREKGERRDSAAIHAAESRCAGSARECCRRAADCFERQTRTLHGRNHHGAGV